MSDEYPVKDQLLGKREVPRTSPSSLSMAAARIGFSKKEVMELKRLYGHLETKNAN